MIELLNAPIEKELRKVRIGQEVEYADAWIKSLREATVANNCARGMDSIGIFSV